MYQPASALFCFLYSHVLQVIKNRIEDLIAREYIERDAENGDMYRYRVIWLMWSNSWLRISDLLALQIPCLSVVV